jgi:formate-dependent nitrite reductase cytochrome c552 subunit
MTKSRRRVLWVFWAVLTLGIGGYLALGLFTKDAGMNPWLASARALFLPGETTHGHYQIELACESCHTEPFGGKATMQDACVNCHGAALKAANDTHPLTKFTDPRNADRLEKLDATQCVTCHTEHRPRITHAMGVSLPQDLCFNCHSEVARDRPSHEGLGFETCGSAGCHKYHDNRALYGDFLVKHAKDPARSGKGVVAERDFRRTIQDLVSYPLERHPLRKLGFAEADAPTHVARADHVTSDWLASTHANNGVNCSGCHGVKKDEASAYAWVQKPDHTACAACHGSEVQGFLAGKHGMRLERGLSAMTPASARRPMKADAHSNALGCATCHSAHAFDTRKAAVEACTGCHDDTHTREYVGSPHHELWQKELAGTLPPGSGVTCATCHMPRVDHRQDDVKRTLVQHNQNDTLAPNEKMLRPVCMACHGLPFSIDALADRALVTRNFKGRPAAHIRSVDMALDAERRAEASRKREKEQQ